MPRLGQRPDRYDGENYEEYLTPGRALVLRQFRMADVGERKPLQVIIVTRDDIEYVGLAFLEETIRVENKLPAANDNIQNYDIVIEPIV